MLVNTEVNDGSTSRINDCVTQSITLSFKDCLNASIRSHIFNSYKGITPTSDELGCKTGLQSDDVYVTDLYIVPKRPAGNQLEGIKRSRRWSEMQVFNDVQLRGLWEFFMCCFEPSCSPSVSRHLAGFGLLPQLISPQSEFLCTEMLMTTPISQDQKIYCGSL